MCWMNPNSLDNKGSCWNLLDFYCSVTMLRELGLTVYKIHFDSIVKVTVYILSYFVKINQLRKTPCYTC